MSGGGLDFSAAEIQERLDAMVFANEGGVAGGFQSHHVERPDEAMMAREEGEELGVAMRQELFHAVLNYFFADGAHPVDVARRVFCLARTGCPEVLAGAAGEVVRGVCGDGGAELRERAGYVMGWVAGGAWRRTARAFCGGDGDFLDLGFGDDVDEFLFFVNLVLRKVSVDDAGMMRMRVAPLGEVLRWEGARGEVAACLEGLLGFYFWDGVKPLLVVRRVFAVAKALRPELIRGMSLEGVAVLCGDGGRATVSERVKRVVNREMDGCEGSRLASRLSFQKSGSAVAMYRAAQMGNSNRKS